MLTSDQPGIFYLAVNQNYHGGRWLFSGQVTGTTYMVNLTVLININHVPPTLSHVTLKLHEPFQTIDFDGLILLES